MIAPFIRRKNLKLLLKYTNLVIKRKKREKKENDQNLVVLSTLFEV